MELNYYQNKQKLPHELTNDFRLWKNAQPVGQPLKCHQLTLIWVNFLGFEFVLRLEGSKITTPRQPPPLPSVQNSLELC